MLAGILGANLARKGLKKKKKELNQEKQHRIKTSKCSWLRCDERKSKNGFTKGKRHTQAGDH